MHATSVACPFYRTCADAELQAAVTQHASDCKQQLTDSTAGISNLLSKVLADAVMHMEESAVHQASCFYVLSVGVRLLLCQGALQSYEQQQGIHPPGSFYAWPHPYRAAAYAACLQVWSDVLQQMPVRAEMINHLESAIEVCSTVWLLPVLTNAYSTLPHLVPSALRAELACIPP